MKYVALASLVLAVPFVGALLVTDEAPAPPAATPVADAPPVAYASPDSCAAAEPIARKSGTARIATWNIRWFPDGTFKDEPSEVDATDVDWLACEVRRLDADVIAVQEFKKHDRARKATEQLIARLNRDTRGDWKVVLDDCPGENLTHIGFLYDASRVLAEDFHDIAVLNANGGACESAEHPGLAGHFTFEGGLDVELVAIHAKAGFKDDDIDQRRRTFAAMREAYRVARARHEERDVIFLGDFNTNGCSDGCAPQVSAREEIDALARTVEADGLRLVPSDAACSEFFEGKFWMLDHFVVGSDMLEARGAVASVGGFCAEMECREDAPMARAESQLSDHCPVTLTLRDADFDDEGERITMDARR